MTLRLSDVTFAAMFRLVWRSHHPSRLLTCTRISRSCRIPAKAAATAGNSPPPAKPARAGDDEDDGDDNFDGEEGYSDVERKVRSGGSGGGVGLLARGGTFLGKFLAGRDEQEVKEEAARLFEKVKVVKPPASRSDSSEMYLLATGFLKKS